MRLRYDQGWYWGYHVAVSAAMARQHSENVRPVRPSALRSPSPTSATSTQEGLLVGADGGEVDSTTTSSGPPVPGEELASIDGRGEESKVPGVVLDGTERRGDAAVRQVIHQLQGIRRRQQEEPRLPGPLTEQGAATQGVDA